jgi:hypothetical protein
VANKVLVADPDGVVHAFDTAAQAAEFEKAVSGK